MKHLILFLMLFPVGAFAQQDSLDLLSQHAALKSRIAVLEQQLADQQYALRRVTGQVALLLEEIKEGKLESGTAFAVITDENEQLRQIMIGYVKAIDQLNALNLALESELEECKAEKNDN